jgi:hypothetical protein
MTDAYIAGLRRERAKYVQSGRTDRVRQVDAELARVGATPVEAAVDEAPERAVPARPAARKASRARKRS